MDADASTKAIGDLMKDTTIPAAERNRRLEVLMSEFGTEEQQAQLDVSDTSDNDDRKRKSLRTAAIEAKIVSKNIRRLTMQEEEDEEGQNSEQAEFRAAHQPATIASQPEDETASEIESGLGYGSLPHPDEIRLSSNHPLDAGLDPPSTGQNPDLGLAVASAVTGDEDPDFVVMAIEFDPDAKPPLHKNRRFRAYTCLAFSITAVILVLVVVYVTASTKGTQIVEQESYYQADPTSQPSLSPITERQRSGIIEQLQGGVLLRNETFREMSEFDPRMKALDWILHADSQQLDSDDVNLYQRYTLALIAYNFDSDSWYYCPSSPMHSNDKCDVPYGDGLSKTYGVWLSGLSECEWYGVTCSADGVVRAVDLIQNDLIGTIPHELAALNSLQLLAFPYNCIYGTIPSEIGSLRHLLSLELHGNVLSGIIPVPSPPDSMYDMDKLQLLNLANQYGQNRNCTSSSNQVIDMKYKFGGLAGQIEAHGLEGKLGASLADFRSMKGLYLQNNALTGVIHEDVGNLRYLRWLFLNDNFLEGTIPEKLGNSMYGSIPLGLYNLTKLEMIRLDDTRQASSPWNIDPDEGFTGTISTRIGQLQRLKILLLSNNPLSGTM
ncbi:hypothetical protein THAOC_16324 [Thalassiosira oceanica]|uniref:Leucine-rich repeat-containing N-terminal plant-type domain-containing protein n=1 Tax=Thalassiosira oceanica TaxID=159749 RepID=K0SCE4_THAOC|nr:hypothetical protein THAOC_16324 [Thalassiosira oceanica]|eukprot:EJK63040.1 hypothetical protein THAOC_16324 [Thalassiosira oceanica]